MGRGFPDLSWWIILKIKTWSNFRHKVIIIEESQKRNCATHAGVRLDAAGHIRTQLDAAGSSYLHVVTRISSLPSALTSTNWRSKNHPWLSITRSFIISSLFQSSSSSVNVTSQWEMRSFFGKFRIVKFYSCILHSKGSKNKKSNLTVCPDNIQLIIPISGSYQNLSTFTIRERDTQNFKRHVRSTCDGVRAPASVER